MDGDEIETVFIVLQGAGGDLEFYIGDLSEAGRAHNGFVKFGKKMTKEQRMFLLGSIRFHESTNA